MDNSTIQRMEVISWKELMDRLQEHKEKGLDAIVCTAEIQLYATSGLCVITDYEITKDVLSLKIGEDSYIDVQEFYLERCCHSYDWKTGEDIFVLCESSVYEGSYIVLTIGAVE